jgi:FtsX-like permease family
MVFDVTMGDVWLWVRATTRRALGGLVLIALLAGLSGAAALIALVGAGRTRSALDRAVAFHDPGVLNLQAEDAQAFDGLEQIPGVRLVLPFETFIGSTETNDNFLLYTSPRPFGTSVDRIEPAQGRLPAAADEVLLTEQAAAALRVAVGDTFSFESLSWEDFDASNSPDGPTGNEVAGPNLPLKVVGIGSTLIQKIQPDDAAGWVSEEFVAKYDSIIAHLGGVDGFRAAAFVWVDPGEGAVDAVGQAIENAEASISVNRFSAFAEPARTSTGTMASGVLVFAIVAMLAGAGAVAVAVLRYVGRFRADQSALEALGVTRRLHGLFCVASMAPAAALAGVLTVGVTLAAAQLMPFGATARRLDPDVGARPSVLVLIAAGLAVSAFVEVVAVLGARPRAARRGLPPAGAVNRLISGPFGRWPTATTGIGFAVDGRSANQPGAMRAALVAGVLGVAGVAGGLSVVSALDGLHDTPARWGYTWTATIEDGDTAAADAQELLAAPDLDSAVGGWAIRSAATATVNGVDVRADALDVRAGPIAPAIRRGRAPTTPSEVVLSSSLAADLHVSIGDSVSATTDSGSVPLTVVGEATLYPGAPALLRYPAVLLTPTGQAQISHGRTEFWIAFLAAPGTSADELYDRLSAVLGDGAPPRADALAVVPSEVRNAVQLRGVALALTLFTGALGLLLIANAVFMTPRRRGHDLAVLTAIGMKRAQTARMIELQAATISLISIVVGDPVGVIAGRLVFAGIAEHVGTDAGPAVAWSAVAAVIGAVVVLTPLIAAWPAWRASRARPAAALRWE